MIRLSAFSDEGGVTLAEQIDALKASGIRLCEIRSIDNKNIKKITLEEAKLYKAELDAAGIGVSAIGSPLGKVKVSVDMSEYENEIRHICELANIFGTDKIRMFSFFEAYSEREEVIEKLSRMVGIGKEYGVLMCHENEKGIYGDTAERVLDIYGNVKGLGFVYDPANYLQVGEASEKTLSETFKISNYFHIKDVITETGELVPAGQGDGQIAKMLGMIDFDTVTTLEPHLKVFSGYSEIDGEKMKHKFSYSSNSEAFGAAAKAFRELLIANGYTETEEGAFERL
jgi:sugar phosphate isomerase/epimerase